MTKPVPPGAIAASAPHAAVHARYRATPIHGPTGWSPEISRLLGHATVRDYLPTELPDGTLETLVAAAQSAPTSSNLQSWSVIAVRDAARRARFAELAGNQRHIAVAPLLLVFLADLSRARRLAAAQHREAEAIDYLDSFVVAATDAALAAQNAVVAAESLGLGTVYIGALRNRIGDVAAELRLPPLVAPVFGLVVGYPDPEKPAGIKPRLPASAVLSHDVYDATGEAEDVAAYNARLRTFQADQGLPPVDWSSVVVDRFATPTALNGRQHLSGALGALGFALK